MLRRVKLPKPNPRVPTTRIKHNTLFYQGLSASQIQAAKYTGLDGFISSTGQRVACSGRNKLQPLDVMIKLFLGKEIGDVDLQPFNTPLSYLNPVKWAATGRSSAKKWYSGTHVGAVDAKLAIEKGSVSHHAHVYSQVSVAQDTDIKSHKTHKYDLWKKSAAPGDKLILWGVSRGAATTFNALAEYQYPEVKLVVLEGCFYSMPDVFARTHSFASAWLKRKAASLVTQYKDDGTSPAKNVAQFPAHVPVVFVTSEKDKTVPSESTEKLANELAARGLNDVYLLKLKKSSHANYMFDDKEDRDVYETFIHAIYKRYHCPYQSELAKSGDALIEKCMLSRDTKVSAYKFFQRKAEHKDIARKDDKDMYKFMMAGLDFKLR